MTRFCVALLCMLLAPCPSLAQPCTLHRECPGATLCDGTCKPLADVLTPSGGSLFWVDAHNGNNTNNGSKTKPWKTIARATAPGVLSPGDAVVIRGGTYREEIRPRSGGTSSAFVTFAAYPGEEVVVTGADVVNKPGQGYTAWKQQADGSWRHAWIWQAQPAYGKYAADQRRELFVDNGEVLVQQGGQERPSLQAGQFWVEGSDASPVAVYVKTFNGTNPNAHTMEVGQRHQLFYSAQEKSQQCGQEHEGYYRLIGMTFKHGTSKRQLMVVCAGKRGSLIEDVKAVWNNGGGIMLRGRDHVVRGATANHNGIEGLGGTGCNDCLIEYSVASYNHWKGKPGQGHGGGGKFTRSNHSTFRHNTYVGNNGPGLWLDINNHDNEVYSNRLDSNVVAGIFIEFGSSRNRAYNNVVTRTQHSDVRKNTIGFGILISASDSNLIAYNTLMGNDGSGLKIAGDDRRDAVGNLVYNNLFVAGPASRPRRYHDVILIGRGRKGVPGHNKPENRWARAASNRFDGNAYWPSGAPSPRTVFVMMPGRPDQGKDLTTSRLEEWQQAGVAFDRQGMVADLERPTVLNPAAWLHGWQLAPGSQYVGRAVALPEGIPPILTDFFGRARPASGGDVGAHQHE